MQAVSSWTSIGGSEQSVGMGALPYRSAVLTATFVPKRVKSSQVKLLLTYLFSEGTYVSINDVSPLDGSPSAISIDSRPPLLRAGFRSTFDRLPYGCLLFLYRLDLT